MLGYFLVEPVLNINKVACAMTQYNCIRCASNHRSLDRRSSTLPLEHILVFSQGYSKEDLEIYFSVDSIIFPKSTTTNQTKLQHLSLETLRLINKYDHDNRQLWMGNNFLTARERVQHFGLELLNDQTTSVKSIVDDHLYLFSEKLEASLWLRCVTRNVIGQTTGRGYVCVRAEYVLVWCSTLHSL